MNPLASFLLSCLLNSLWQLPLLFAAGWLAARALRPFGPAAGHRTWVATLLAQTLLPIASSLPGNWRQTLLAFFAFSHPASTSRVLVIQGQGTLSSSLHLPSTLQVTAAVTYILVTLYVLARLLWRASKLVHLRRQATPLPLTADSLAFFQHCSRFFATDSVALCASGHVHGPVTFGLRRKLILLPAEIAASLSQADLHTVLAHEFAHLARHDFLKNLAYEILTLPVQYHPLLWLTRDQLTTTREMVCDHLAAPLTGRTQYAQSLLHLASLLVKGASPSHAIGLLDATAFERRLMSLTQLPTHLPASRRIAAITACALLAATACTSALALSLRVDASSPATITAPAPTEPLTVPSGVMAGNKLDGPNPQYPADAKKAKIQGAVVLSAVINKEGTIEQLKVLSGPKELQGSSLDAVRQWKYKPYLLNGEPIAVETTVHVIYSLGK